MSTWTDKMWQGFCAAEEQHARDSWRLNFIARMLRKGMAPQKIKGLIREWEKPDGK
jgi:hypothetical protein